LREPVHGGLSAGIDIGGPQEVDEAVEVGGHEAQVALAEACPLAQAGFDAGDVLAPW
jgi:hypothetical protein